MRECYTYCKVFILWKKCTKIHSKWLHPYYCFLTFDAYFFQFTIDFFVPIYVYTLFYTILWFSGKNIFGCTRTSPVVTHPSANRAKSCLTSLCEYNVIRLHHNTCMYFRINRNNYLKTVAFRCIQKIVPNFYCENYGTNGCTFYDLH
jgi:hypothetical protein